MTGVREKSSRCYLSDLRQRYLRGRCTLFPSEALIMRARPCEDASIATGVFPRQVKLHALACFAGGPRRKLQQMRQSPARCDKPTRNSSDSNFRLRTEKRVTNYASKSPSASISIRESVQIHGSIYAGERLNRIYCGGINDVSLKKDDQLRSSNQ